MFKFLLKKRQPVEPDASHIVPRIKHTNFLQALRDIGTGLDDTPITEPFVADLLIAYAFDFPDWFEMVRPLDCERLGLVQGQLRQIAVANLRKQIGELGEIHIENLADGKLTTPFFMLVTGNDLEACLLLLDEIWDPLSRMVDGDLVVAVPARDLVLVTGSRSPETLQMAREAFDWEPRDQAEKQNKTHSLTRHLLTRKSGRWEIFAPQPPSISAPDDDDRYKPPSERRGYHSDE